MAPVHLRFKYRLPTWNCPPRVLQLLTRTGIHRASQPILRIVRNLPAHRRSLFALITASTGPKISSWAIRAVGRDIRNHRRLQIKSALRRRDRIAASNQPPFSLADLDIAENRIHRGAG